MENNTIATIVEHPDISFQVLLTQKTDGSLEFLFVDHISKTLVPVVESQISDDNKILPYSKLLIEKINNFFLNLNKLSRIRSIS